MDYSIRKHSENAALFTVKSPVFSRSDVTITANETRKIPGHENYSVDRMGNIYNIKNGKLRIPRLRRNGYFDINLDGKMYYVHRLVAFAWLERGPEFTVVNHKNHDRKDNRVENLEWCTPAYNNSDPGKAPGKPHGKAPVAGFVGDEPVIWLNSMAAAAAYVGVDPCSIRRCCDGVLLTAGKIGGHRVTWRRTGRGMQYPATLLYLPAKGSMDTISMKGGEMPRNSI